MATTRKVDICVVGAGSGGLTVAAGASQMGASVVLVEKHKMGGDCLNYGCVPSKALLAAAHAAETYRRRAEHRAKLARTFLPMVLTITIGGTAVLLYALLLFVPYVGMLRALGLP